MLLLWPLRDIYTFKTSLKAIHNLTHFTILSIRKTTSPAARARLSHTTWIGGGDVDTFSPRDSSGIKPDSKVKYIILGFTRLYGPGCYTNSRISKPNKVISISAVKRKMIFMKYYFLVYSKSPDFN